MTDFAPRHRLLALAGAIAIACAACAPTPPAPPASMDDRPTKDEATADAATASSSDVHRFEIGTLQAAVLRDGGITVPNDGSTIAMGEPRAEVDALLQAAGLATDPLQLSMQGLLVQAGESGVAAGTLAERLGVPASSMSFHLAQLANAGLVTQRRESRSIIYSADYGAMNTLMGYLTENCCGGIDGCVGGTAACSPQEVKRTA